MGEGRSVTLLFPLSPAKGQALDTALHHFPKQRSLVSSWDLRSLIGILQGPACLGVGRGSDPVNNGRTVYLAQGKESYLPWQVVILCPFTHPAFSPGHGLTVRQVWSGTQALARQTEKCTQCFSPCPSVSSTLGSFPLLSSSDETKNEFSS